MAKIAVLGSGGWGCALAIMAAKHSNDVTVWSVFPEEIKKLEHDREHKALLPGVKFPENLILTDDISCVKNKDLVILAVPSFAVRSTAGMLKGILDRGQIITNVAKGFEPDTLLRLSEVIASELPQSRIVVLSGPSHAEEVSRGTPTTVVASSNDLDAATKVQVMLMNPSFRVYVNSDVIGVELGGALKNIIALAAGVVDGLELGDNTKAALMTRGLSEIARLGCAMGAKNETFAGLAGVGDLIVTCCSMHSRNRRAGILIGKGVASTDAIKQVGMVEGYPATAAAYKIANQYNVEMPITEQCYHVLYEGKNPRQALYDLMERPKQHETERVWLK